MIHAEFRRAATEHRDNDTFIMRADVSAVPDRGEVININGEPYRVIERGWALASDQPGIYCYLRVR